MDAEPVTANSGDRSPAEENSSPESPAERTPRSSRRDFLWIALAAVVLLIPAMLATELTTTDEARYTQVAREMRLDGRWLAPRLNGIEYWQKPALFFDILQIPQRITGSWSALGSRIMILPFAILTLFFTYGCGRILAGRRAARGAAAILLTTGLFYEYSHTAVLDIPMLAFITAAFYCYLRGTRGTGPTLRWQWGCAIAMGLGCHFKGPIAILLPGVVFALDHLPRRGLAALKHPAPYWVPVAALHVLGLWFVPMAIAYDDFSSYMYNKHIVERSVSKAAPHQKPITYYPPNILASWLPWILLAPLAFVATARGGGLRAAPDPSQDNPLRFPCIWAWSIPIILSLISSKRTQYLLPAVPGFALWIAIAADGWLRTGALPDRFRRATAIVVRGVLGGGTLIGVLAALAVIFCRLWPESVPWPEDVPPPVTEAARESTWLLIGLTIAAFMGLATALARKSTPARIILALLIFGAGGNLVRAVAVEGARDRWIRPNEFGADLRSLREGGAEIGIFAMRLHGTYQLHSGATSFQPVNNAELINAYLESETPRTVIGKHRYFRRDIWKVLTPEPVGIISTHREGRSQVALIGNAAAIELWNALHPDRPAILVERPEPAGESETTTPK